MRGNSALGVTSVVTKRKAAIPKNEIPALFRFLAPSSGATTNARGILSIRQGLEGGWASESATQPAHARTCLSPTAVQLSVRFDML